MRKSLLLLMLLLPLLSFAQNDFKLAEQNPKEKPNWVTESNVRDVLMVQANRMPTLKEAYYDYYILYPLTSQDLAKMIDDYNKAKALDKYPNEWKNFTSHNFIYDIQSEGKNADRSDTELVNTLLEVARTNIAKQIQIKVEGNSSVKGKTTYATDVDVNLVLTKSHFNPHSNKMYVMAYINKEAARDAYKKITPKIINLVTENIK